MDLGAIERSSLATAIAARLRAYILSGPFRPGDRLPSERELAQVLDVTRTTLREALKILETLKFVVVRHGDGVRVRDWLRSGNLEVLADLLLVSGEPDPAIVANLLEARLLFGRFLARLAAERRTDEHLAEYDRRLDALAAAGPEGILQADLDCFDTLANASGNLVFVFVLDSIRSVTLHHRNVFARLYIHPEEVLQGHRAVRAALADRDADAAEAAIAGMLGRQGL